MKVFEIKERECEFIIASSKDEAIKYYKNTKNEEIDSDKLRECNLDE